MPLTTRDTSAPLPPRGGPLSRPLSRRAILGVGLTATLTAAGCVSDPRAQAPEPPRIKTPYKFGLHVNEDHLDANLRRAEELAGRKADVVLVFAKLSERPGTKLRRLMSAGYEVALTLEFWDGKHPHDPAYSLRQVAAGRHDAALDGWLEALRDLPGEVHLRPLHEFNGDWYPWGVYGPGNRLDDFVPAWRHVADRARDVTGGRIVLQLAYNRLHAQRRRDPLRRFYPGDDYVDEFAINGYMRPGKHRWKSFVGIIGPFYRQLRAINPHKPIWIGETACTEHGGNKAAWITGMFDAVLTTHPVACLTWFDEYVRVQGEPDRDWPFDTTPAALRAFQKGVKRARPATAAVPVTPPGSA